jgi:transposase
MQRQAYPSSPTDGPWEVVPSLMRAAKNGRTGRPRKYPLRERWYALMYIARRGCSWRQLPHGFPPWLMKYRRLREFPTRLDPARHDQPRGSSPPARVRLA